MEMVQVVTELAPVMHLAEVKEMALQMVLVSVQARFYE